MVGDYRGGSPLGGIEARTAQADDEVSEVSEGDGPRGGLPVHQIEEEALGTTEAMHA